MTMFFCVELLFVTCWKLGLFYYFNKLLVFVAIAFLGTLAGETLAAHLRILCKSNALACWANCFCCNYTIVNSWHNSNLVKVDCSWENKFLWHFRFHVGLQMHRWLLYSSAMSRKTYLLAYTEVSGHLLYSTLFQNNLIFLVKNYDIVVCLNVLASYSWYFFFCQFLVLKRVQSWIRVNTVILMLNSDLLREHLWSAVCGWVEGCYGVSCLRAGLPCS